MIGRCQIPSVFGIHREAIEVLPEGLGHRHGVGRDDVASEPLLASSASLIALSPPRSLCEATVPRHLATPSVDAISPAFEQAGMLGSILIL